jgi:mannose-6-phosphate isomerase-like protein (cupin superfamily)
MKLIKTTKKRETFELLFATRHLQAAMMTLRPGASSSPKPDNEHPRCEQWLFVVSGTGEARIGKESGRLRRIKLNAASLLLIEASELHQITNVGRLPLVTLNFYAPPAYRKDGEPRFLAKRPKFLPRLL